MRHLLPPLIVLALVPAVLAQGQAAPPTTQPGTQAQPAPANAGLYPRVKMETSLGDIVIELNGEKAPISTQNFIQYAEEGFYNGTIFHRVIKTFMIQGGGFTPDLQQKRQGLHPPIKNEWRNGLKNERGTIAMARTNFPDSATAQFFINVVDNTKGHRIDLDTPRPSPKGPAAYAVFGRVVEGMDVVDKIKDVPVQENSKYPSAQPVVPVEPVIIKSVTLVGQYDRAKVDQAAAEAVKKAEEEEAKAEQERKMAAAASEKQLQDFIAKTEAETGKKFEKTATDLMYLKLTEGKGPAVTPTSKVQAHYTGWLVDGTKFDSSVDRGQPITVDLARRGVIRGWLEGLKMMHLGDKWKFVIPPALAYGPSGRPPVIPPNSTLVFDIEVVGVN